MGSMIATRRVRVPRAMTRRETRGRLRRFGSARSAFLLFPFFAGVLAGGAAAGAFPRIEMAETGHDFGTVEQGTLVRYVFRLVNRGTGDLHIGDASASCGCTVGLVSAPTVPPGGDGAIEVSFDTARFRGRKTKAVTVRTDDPDVPVLILSLTGTVTAEVAAEPPALYLGRIRRGVGAQGEIRLVGAGTRPFAVSSVTSGNPRLQVAVEPVADAAGSGHRLIVRAGAGMPLGRFNDTLSVATSNPRHPRVEVPVFGSVEADLVVLPSQITFRPADRGMARERELRLQNQGPVPVFISEIKVPAGLLEYALDAIREGYEYRVRLRLRDHVPTGFLRQAVEIRTTHPEQGQIVVPLHGIAAGGRRRPG
jgi:hypothetical protein